MKRLHPKLVAPLLGLGSCAGVLLMWWLISAFSLVNSFILPSPAAIVESVLRLNSGYLGSTLVGHLFASLSVVLSGYALAVLVGVTLGITMAWLPALDDVFGPLTNILRPIPPPAWIPLAILWFGIGLSGKTFVVFVSSVTPCLVNSYVAIKKVPPGSIDAARMLGATSTDLLFRVALPAGLPLIANGMRIALGSAWATVVAAELVVATAGFGFVIMSGYRNFESDVMAAGILAVAVTGFTLDLCFQRVEQRFLVWCDRE